MLWNEEKVIEAIKGISNGMPFNATGVCINTRHLKDGDLFVAIEGGEKYLEQAIELGAVAAIVPSSNNHFDWNKKIPIIEVSDTMQALIDLGQYKRNSTNAKYISITGSVGKTGTKEMTAKILSFFGKTYATAGNYNNNYGVPLTLANMPEDTEFAVIELGMSAPGEISELVKQVRPEIALITTVAECHTEFFESLEEIAMAKSEIFEALNGTAIINKESPCFDTMYRQARKYTDSIKTFGYSDDNDLILTNVECFAEYSKVTITSDEYPYTFDLPIPGKHIALNSCGVLSIIQELGLDMNIACKKIEKISAFKGRGESFKSKIAEDAYITIIDESYNASPIAMIASIDTFALKNSEGRKILVIGDMLELGEKAKELHLSILPSILKANIDKVYCCGKMMKHVYDNLPLNIQGAYAKNSEELLPLIKRDIKNNDILLCKSSHGSKISIIVDCFNSSNI